MEFTCYVLPGDREQIIKKTATIAIKRRCELEIITGGTGYCEGIVTGKAPNGIELKFFVRVNVHGAIINIKWYNDEMKQNTIQDKIWDVNMISCADSCAEMPTITTTEGFSILHEHEVICKSDALHQFQPNVVPRAGLENAFWTETWTHISVLSILFLMSLLYFARGHPRRVENTI